MSVSEARAALPQLLDRVADGDEITITRHGRAVAVLVRPDVLRARRADEVLAAADRLAEQLVRARARGLLAPALTAAQADELVEHVRAGRAG
jgi:antitoxin (DNA-binding transcriptional repressor) of toxin-antitoxin stability system